MSLESWMEEFYPVLAKDVAPGKAAVLHSLQKWRGLTPENKERHGVSGDRYLSEDAFPFDTLVIDASSCALCHRYEMNQVASDPCLDCPLFQALDEHCAESHTSPYCVYVDEGNPHPMIAALEGALEIIIAREQLDAEAA